MKISYFRKRLPSINEVYSVFSVAIFCVCSWSLRGFLYKLPSFMLYLPTGEILAVLSFMLAVALIESVFVTVGLVFLSFIFPAVFLRNGFAYKGFIVLLVAAIALIWIQTIAPGKSTQLSDYYVGGIISLLVMSILIFISHKFTSLSHLLGQIVDRLEVFPYLYVPLGVISLLIIVVRNLF